MDVVDELFDDTMDLDVGPTQPKPSRFQPKVKSKGKVKLEPSRPQPRTPNAMPPAAKSTHLDRTDLLKVPLETHSAVGNGATVDETEAERSSMGVEELGEDVVVQEFDVYINSSFDADTKLYNMQYPLRPSWRPYELDERCEQIRIKPKLSRFEIDLSLDLDNNENYSRQDDDISMLTTQTLSSSTIPSLNEFAVGILRGNQFHVNPVHSVVQYRPSMAHVDGDPEVNEDGHHPESNLTPIERSVESPKVSDNKGMTSQEDAKEVNKNVDINEPWTLLEYHAIESPLSCFYIEKAMTEEMKHIPFAMKSVDYLNSYSMASPVSNRKAICPSIRYLLTKPLEDRLKQWFSEGPQVNRFGALLHLAPTDSTEHVLKLLQHHAYLVQGLWVSKSSLLFDGDEVLYRDYILLQFSKNCAIHEGKLKVVKPEFGQRLLKPLAVQRPLFKDWKFKENPDSLFIKQYPEIVKAQEHDWSIRERKILESLPSSGISLMLKNSTKHGPTSRATGSGVPCHSKKGNIVSNSINATIPNKGKDALVKAVMELLQVHKVLSLNSIIQGLQGKINAGSSDVENVAGLIAIKVHDVYVLKSSGKPALDQFRNVVIQYLSGKQRNAKVKKQEIKHAAMIKHTKDVSDSEYNQVMNELCMCSSGSWELKSGVLC